MRMLCDFKNYLVDKTKSEQEASDLLQGFDRQLISTPEQFDDLQQRIINAVAEINRNNPRQLTITLECRELSTFHQYRYTVSNSKHGIGALDMLYVKADYQI